MRIVTRLLGVALVAAAGPLAAQTASLPLTHKPQPTKAEITAADLMTRLYIFAADSMLGREAGMPGNVKGTNYIAAEIKRMGLVPAGDNGTYFQTIPLKTREFDTTSTFTVGGAALTPYVDYAPNGRVPIDNAALSVVYGGELSDSAHWITPEQATGKLVVFRARGGVFGRRVRVPQLPGATAMAIIGLDSIPPQVMGFFRRPQTFVDDVPPGTPAPRPSFFISSAVAARMFGKPLDSLTTGAAGGTAALAVHYTVTPVADPARNVIGIIPGSDPKLKGEYVAVGGHNDHIGIARPVDHDSVRIFNEIVRPEGADDGRKQPTPEQTAQVNQRLAAWRAAHPGSTRIDSISNGADDDGSGTVSALEIAEYFAAMKVKPKRSLIFVWHVGEEKGLLGSRFFTDHPTVERDSIVAQLNMDMVGRGGAGDETGRTKDGTPLHGSAGYLQLVGSRRLSTELGNLIEQVNTQDHHNMAFDYAMDADGHPSNIYCRSDHYEYARYGIPITFFTTGLHRDYHQVTDEPEYIDYEHMARVDKLVADVALHVANLDHRVVVDKPKPDPNGQCRQ
ncbi:MAG TPA: M28 family peptidase [Gemmatimonadales bacterium]